MIYYQEAQTKENMCVVKVHFTFNFTVSVPRGSSYAVLIGKISEKLELPSSAITLRYRLKFSQCRNVANVLFYWRFCFDFSLDASGQSLIDANTAMEEVWSRVCDGRVALWCNTKEVSGDFLLRMQPIK